MDSKSNLSRRAFLRVSAATVAGAALAACGATATPTATPKPAAPVPAVATAVPAPKVKQTIRFTMFGHPNMVEQMVPLFNMKSTDVKVEFERSESQGYYEKLPAAIAGGGAWDVFRLGLPEGQQYGGKGAVADIKDMVDKDTVYPRSGYVDGLLDTWKVGDKLVGLPGWTNCFWLYYNTKLFDEAGIAYPTTKTTWEEYVEMIKKLTKRDGNTITQYGAATWGASITRCRADAWNAGAPFWYSDDLKTASFTNATAVKVMQDEADMMNALKVHPSPLNPPSSPATILSGKVATEMMGDWYPWDNNTTWKPEYQATMLPLRGSKRTNLYVHDGLCINAQSKVKEAAYKWISWWSCDPESWNVQGPVVFPTTKKMYTDATLRALWARAPRPQTMIDLALEHNQTAKFNTLGVEAAQMQNEVWNPEVDNLWRAKVTAQQAMTTIETKANELIKKTRGG
jgi:multiple sugar transport system substrate-binding protein